MQFLSGHFLPAPLHPARFHDNGVFQIRIAAVVNASPEYIRDVLSDYLHIYRLSPSIIESEVLPHTANGEKHVRTRLLCCTSVFCREVERVDVVRQLESGDLQAEIVPALSEFKAGKATWKIKPVDEHSYLVYEAFLEPDFFIPPVVGTSVVKNNLKNEFVITRSEDGGKQIVVTSLPEAKKAMAEVENLNIARLQALEKNHRYQVRIKAELSRITLPFYLHYVFRFFLFLWDFETDWYATDFMY